MAVCPTGPFCEYSYSEINGLGGGGSKNRKAPPGGYLRSCILYINSYIKVIGGKSLEKMGRRNLASGLSKTDISERHSAVRGVF